MHHTLMKRAIQQAHLAAERGEVPVGALVLSPEGDILAEDGNRMREHKDPTAHAEMVVLRQAAEKLGQWRLDGCALYVTLEPCAMCAGALSLAKIKTLCFGALAPKGGGVLHGGRFYDQPTCHHRPEVISGLEEEVCSLILKDFFKARRRGIRGS
jgi:tRNA(Arg) A34 adenosine deaminase TadA